MRKDILIGIAATAAAITGALAARAAEIVVNPPAEGLANVGAERATRPTITASRRHRTTS